MSIKLINFSIADLKNNDACIEHIQTHDHLVVAGSGFLVNTSKSLDILRRELAEYFDKADELFIVKLKEKDWLSFHLGAKKKWIEENI